MLFEKQYILTERVEVETRYRTETDTWTDEEGNSHTDTYEVPYDYYICYVTLENFDLSHVPVYIMSEEQLSLMPCICPPWATGLTYSPDTPTPQGGRTIWTMTYPRRHWRTRRLPPCLRRRRNTWASPMFGAGPPSTSFDCSGFCLLGHQPFRLGRGRLGAQGLCDICTPVSPPTPDPATSFSLREPMTLPAFPTAAFMWATP